MGCGYCKNECEHEECKQSLTVLPCGCKPCLCVPRPTCKPLCPPCPIERTVTEVEIPEEE